MNFKEKDVVIDTTMVSRGRGEIQSLVGTNHARVLFKKPQEVKVCAACGSWFNLSKNGATGEITCMKSGCGHDHGFTEESHVVPLSHLKNISLQVFEASKKRYNAKLAELIKEGKTMGFLS